MTCRSRIPRLPDKQELGWECDADPKRLVQVMTAPRDIYDAEGGRVPVLAPAAIFADDFEHLPDFHSVFDIEPYAGERDHAHLVLEADTAAELARREGQ